MAVKKNGAVRSRSRRPASGRTTRAWRRPSATSAPSSVTRELSGSIHFGTLAADLGHNSKDHAEVAAPQSQLRAEVATACVNDHLYILQRRPAVNSYTTVERRGCRQQWHVAFIPTRAVDATSACPALRWVGDLLGVAAQAYRILTRLHRRITGSCTRTGTTACYGTTALSKRTPGEDQSCVQRPP